MLEISIRVHMHRLQGYKSKANDGRSRCPHGSLDFLNTVTML